MARSAWYEYSHISAGTLSGVEAPPPPPTPITGTCYLPIFYASSIITKWNLLPCSRLVLIHYKGRLGTMSNNVLQLFVLLFSRRSRHTKHFSARTKEIDISIVFDVWKHDLVTRSVFCAPSTDRWLHSVQFPTYRIFLALRPKLNHLPSNIYHTAWNKGPGLSHLQTWRKLPCLPQQSRTTKLLCKSQL